MIADERVAWSFWVFADVYRIRRSASCYRTYLDHATQWASTAKCRTDEIERVLFLLGPMFEALYNSRPRLWKSQC